MRMPTSIPQLILLSASLVLFSLTSKSHGFTVEPNVAHTRNTLHTPTVPARSEFVNSARSSSSSRLYALPEIGDMKVGDIRQELESYGISTRTFLEKKEFTVALEQARREGKTPVDSGKPKSNGTTDPSKESSGSKKSEEKSASSAKADADEEGPSKADRIRLETEKAKAMKVSDLKKKLNDMGISTKSFFEKSEFIKAYAEAMVNGPKTSADGSPAAAQDEPYDSTYRDVAMQKFGSTDQRMLSGTVIDIRLK